MNSLNGVDLSFSLRFINLMVFSFNRLLYARLIGHPSISDKGKCDKVNKQKAPWI